MDRTIPVLRKRCQGLVISLSWPSGDVRPKPSKSVRSWGQLRGRRGWRDAQAANPSLHSEESLERPMQPLASLTTLMMTFLSNSFS